MLIINANQEQKRVFNKLIQEMNAQVVWNGRFIIMGDRLVLEGFVRSLFLHFDIQKAEVQFMDLPTDDEEEIDLTDYPELEDLITMAVYAFDKWGVLKGVHAGQDVAQLDQMFGLILGAYDLESVFSEDKLEFYQSGMLITYEDVIETVLNFTGVKIKTQSLKMPDVGSQNDETQTAAFGQNTAFSGVNAASAESLADKGAASAGSLTGKKASAKDRADKNMVEENNRKAERIEKYHARIGVLDRLSDLQKKTLERDIRYDKLLSEDEKEELLYPIKDYERQQKMNTAASMSGTVTNGSENGWQTGAAVPRDEKAAAERIEKYHARIGVLDRLSDLQKKTLERDIRNDKLLTEPEKEELLYPIRDYELQEKMSAGQFTSGTIKNVSGDGWQTGAAAPRDEKAAAERIEKYHARIGVLDRLSDLQKKALERDIRTDKLLNESEKEELLYPIRDYELQQQAYGTKNMSESDRNALENAQNSDADGEAVSARNEAVAADRIEKYHARISVLDRLSDLQKKTLARDIRNDRLLYDSEKKDLLFPIQDFEYQEKLNEIDKALKENGSYEFIKKLIDKTEKEDLFEKTKQDILAKLHELRAQIGQQEVREIMEKFPLHVERAEYEELMENLSPYEDVDFGEYKERLRSMRETLEIKEISNMLMHSQKRDRSDYMKLLRDIEEKDFVEENASPYVEQILEWVSELDEEKLKKLVANSGAMDFHTASSVYETIRQESFLPKLRESALAVVSKRLEEISLNECWLLVRALKKMMTGVIQTNPRHHFYPADKILSKTVKPEDIRLIHSAVSAYAEKRGRFEYPLLMVDTSKECNGRDGMLLTSEHIFYSTRLNGYQIPISAVKSIYVSAGLLKNRVITAEEVNGVKHKLPYAVEAEEMTNWSKVLDSFVRFLQGRNQSEKQKLSYESMEGEDAVCCKRCGCIYHESGVCPECGYKKNERMIGIVR